MIDSDDARRANQRKQGCPHCCQGCFGDVWLGSGYLPHDPDCTRAQDQEAAALRRLGAPFPVRENPLNEEGAEYQPPTSWPGVAPWEPEEYTIEGGR